jgi:glycogen synthase
MKGNLKIMMTADTIGGVWTYTIDLCRALQQFPVEIHLLTMGAFPTKAQHLQLNELNNVFLYESNFKLEWMENPWRDVEKAREWISRIYLKVKPDIMHFNNYAQAAQFWNVPTVTVLHSCVQTWWQAVKGERAPESWDPYAKVVRKALVKSDAVVAPTIAMLRQAKEIYGEINNSSIIYNGSYHASPIQKKEPFIFCAGRLWDEAKNIQLLADIADRLSWPVYIAGSNIDSKKTDQANVHFLGQLSPEEMKDQLARASIFVMPATYEPFGLAVLEAAKSGCALVLSNINSLREIWDSAAVYIDPKDPEAAIDSLEQLINNETLRAMMGQKALEKSTVYSAEEMGKNYHRLYRQLVEARIPATPVHQINQYHENSHVLSFPGL